MRKPVVKDYMTRVPFTIERGRSLRDADELMRKHGIRHLPVVDGRHLVGLVSAQDVRLIETLREVSPGNVGVEWAMGETPVTVTARRHQ